MIDAWLGQFCLNVADLDRSVAFYEALGLTCTSRTEIPQAFEAIVERPAAGSTLQLALQKDDEGPIGHGTAFWKLYVDTTDVAGLFDAAITAGAVVESPPERLDRWPVTVAFVRDPDGYLVELVQRDPWPDTAPADGAWLGQFCINVTNLERAIGFYEMLGLTCTSRTEIPHAHEAIVEHPDRGSKLQLAQQVDQDGPVDMGSLWKLYVNTDDCVGLHEQAVNAGHVSVGDPVRLDEWPVTVAFVADPDGYQIEIVQRHED
jgi:lactoylglutathione lyase